MTLDEILKASSVKVGGKVGSKKRLFQVLGEVASTTFAVEPDTVVEALMERESLGPTGVGRGVALPHARIEGLDHVSGVFMRLETPLDFSSVDRQPVDLVFGLFAPVDAGVEHLKALALVSRTMRNPDICAKLRANGDEAALHAILTEAPSSKAA